MAHAHFPSDYFARRRDDRMIQVTIYHNPDCGTSRNTLALIRNAGVEPTVIEYLKTPPDRATLQFLLGDGILEDANFRRPRRSVVSP